VAYAIFGASTAALIDLLAERAGQTAPAHYVAITAVVSMLVALYVMVRRKVLVN
jgi:hypothetical protein